MKGLFTPEELARINAMIREKVERKLKARLGMEEVTESRMMSRRDGLTVSEGICPRCRKPMEKLEKIQNVIRWQCAPCDRIYRIVDPRDEINRLTGGK